MDAAAPETQEVAATEDSVESEDGKEDVPKKKKKKVGFRDRKVIFFCIILYYLCLFIAENATHYVCMLLKCYI